MDRRINSFVTFSILLLLFFAVIIAFFAYVYQYFTIDVYNLMLIILITAAGFIMLTVTFSMLAVLYAYKKRKVGTAIILPVRLALKIFIPITISISGLLKKDKDSIRSLFIDINNILVQSDPRRYFPHEILVILPHCLQNSNCLYKVTGDIGSCKSCGKCSIGEIRAMVEKRGVTAVVVTGGTAARNLIRKERPRVILSVACERDLALGISDISRIPVIGIVNERPNGPCKDTCISMELLSKKLDDILEARTVASNEG